MKALRMALAAAVMMAGATSVTPARAEEPYCECVMRCGHLYPGGGFPYNSCVGVCEATYGLAMCSEATYDMPKDRR